MAAVPGDDRFMGLALALARRGLGRVAPNPAVGCVLVHEGRIVGRGWTQAGGRPHAETEALARAGDKARGATAYVSLEPCAHHGETPPCAEALIAAGVARVVAAIEDPDPRTAGRGMARLEAAGIETLTGCREAEAAALNRGFILKVREGRPFVALKLALSLDGRIASRTGASRWITGEEARRHAHLLRARHDAILVGSGTATADDPELTCRLPGLKDHSPVRILLAGRNAPSSGLKLMKGAGGLPVWLAAPRETSAPDGLEHVTIAAMDGRPDITSLLEVLAFRGITRLLVEGGATVAAAFLRAGLVDRLYLYRAPLAIGGDGLPALDALGVADIGRDAQRFRRLGERTLGPDRLDILEPA